MKILIDNNVIIDVFQNREPFVKHSSKILELCEKNIIEGFITANSITDIFYILKRSIKDVSKIYNYIELLLEIVQIIDVTSNDVYKAIENKRKDLEDDLIYVCSEKNNIDYIITRNEKDFKLSKVKPMTPEEFLKIL
jgi:predicted nucleic acid-binding protein